MVEKRLGRAGEPAEVWDAPGRRQWPWGMVLVVLLVGSALLTGGVGTAECAQPFLIGALTDSWGPTPHVAGLRDGLRALGYREDEQFVIGVRFTQGQAAALPAAAHELVAHGVDLIFAMNEEPAKAAQRATSRIPIVFSGGVDPVGTGLVQSFSRPGGNITGVTDLTLELGPKRLQVFQDMLPGLKRVLFVYDATDASSMAEAGAYRDAAHHLGIMLVERAVRTQEEAQAALAQIQQGDVDGILKPRSLALNIPGILVEVATQRRIPVMFDGAFWVEQGGLASYGPDFYDSGWQAARLVDKIFKGAQPAEIPVEVNTQIKFVINLKTAQTLGLTLTPAVLFQANHLIR